jgi:signal transduction histidine kinase/CheY-like chemotaxis protein/HPt (histidine-containing phosphotransfer) domain-containing protein/CHASE3 domain sensor protein
MRRFALELKVTPLVLIIVAAVIATGYLSYKNLSQIVLFIHKEARPDYKLIRLKEINASLTDVENSVRLYTLTHETKYLGPYNDIVTSIDRKIEELIELQENDTMQIANINAVGDLIGRKMVIWDKMLQLHAHPIEKEVFDEFYTNIEKKTTDTIVPKKSNIFKRFFSKKKKEEITLKKEEVQQEVAKLEKNLNDKTVEQAESESSLIKKNKDLSTRLQFLILQLEQRETENLIHRSRQADELARITYKWLAIFCIAAVVLLLSVLFIILNYSRKSNAYQRILKRAKTEAENLVKTKELFTANVSHELRTPMNAIYGMTEQLLQQPMEPQLKEQLTVIRKSAGYLNKVVDDILDFSKIQAGKLSIEHVPFNPTKIVQEVFALNKVIATQKKLTLLCDIDKTTPVSVLGDPTRFRQILINLLSNALKFTEKGEVSIQLKAIHLAENQVQLKMLIRDTGIGIPADKLDSIFDDYSQADQTINRRFGGTGLGLSIIKSLVELHDGTIEVESTFQKGSTFICTLPYEKSDDLLIEPTENEDEPVIPDAFNKISILVVDDEEYNRLLIKTIIKKWNCNFNIVSNGLEAVNTVSKNFFDLILMDVRMPQMSGYEASAQILKISPKSKIIAITAGNYEEDIKKCKDAGITGFLLKPFSENELVVQVGSILEISLPDPVPIPVNSNQFISFQLDLSDLKRLSNGDETFVNEMLHIFIRTTEEGIQKMKEYLDHKDWEGLADVAHKMTSPCRHLGATRLLKLLKEMENSARQPDTIEIPEDLFLSISTEAKLAVNYIREKTQAI